MVARRVSHQVSCQSASQDEAIEMQDGNNMIGVRKRFAELARAQLLA